MSAKPKIESIYPVSSLQQGLLFYNLLAAGSGVYIEQLTFRLKSSLVKAAFRKAWQKIVDRHAILRTSFHWTEQGKPRQVVLQQLEVPWVEEDWRNRSEVQQTAGLAAFLEQDRLRGFDISRAPLFRCTLIQMADNLHTLVWTNHHAILDGWSRSLLFDEVFRVYEGLRRGEEVELGEVVGYREYIEWVQRQDLGKAERYWRKALAGYEPGGSWGLGRRRKEEEGREEEGREPERGSYGQEVVELSAEASQRLQQFCREEQLTLNTVVQGSWGVLLTGYSGEREVVYGMTVAGRPGELKGVERMVGLFINTLPVRLRVERRKSVREWLRGVQEQLAEMREYEYTPLAEIQGWSEVKGGEGLFETLVVFENYPVERGVGEGMEVLGVEGVWVREQTNYGLTLVVVPGRRVRMQVLYERKRYGAGAMKGLLRQLEAVLGQMAADGGQRVGRISMLTEEDVERIRSEWKESVDEFASSKRLEELFQEQAERAPDVVALVCEDRQISYAELEQRARGLARRLKQVGVGAEVGVGLLLERNEELIVGVLGILYAGGYYIPLDSRHPEERLGYLVEDSGMGVVVSSKELRARIEGEGRDGVRVVEMEEEEGAGGGESWAWKQEEGGGDKRGEGEGGREQQLAYAIYTSGSTGRPKGVLVEHRQVTRLLGATAKRYRFGERDVWTLYHSIGFDFSVWEMWGSLVHGGRLVVVPYWVSREPEEMVKLVKEEEVTVLNQTPSAFYQLSRRVVEGEERLASLRVVIFGGEGLELRRLREWVKEYGEGNPELVNMYGITVTTVHVTYRRLRSEEVRGWGESVIGEGIGDLRVYVLDGEQEMLPEGAVGELYVGGAGVARGYWRRPELTAERFVPDGYSGEVGARMYRSGDLGYWREGGDLVFVGRVDEQVKVRGYRIELGEIEAVLEEHERVSSAVVVVRESGEGEKRLEGYVVLREVGEGGGEGGGGGKGAEVREYLRRRLPEYMVPGKLVVVEQLPLTGKGRVDRRGLLELGERLVGQGEEGSEGGGEGAAERWEEARTPVEEILMKVWEQVLGVERVGRKDNFFALGGDSILSIQIVSRAAQAGVRIRPKQIFEHQTIAALAEVAEPLVAPPVAAGTNDVPTGPVALTPIQSWFFEGNSPGPQHYNHVLLLAPRAPIEAEHLKSSLALVLAHHDALRLRFVRERGEWKQEQSERQPDSDLILRIVDLRFLPANQRRSALESEAAAEQARLDLSSGLLARAVYFQMGEYGDRLLSR